MSSETVKQIIARAVAEVEFREQLLTDSAKAHEGYELTDEERALLQRLTPQEFDAVGGELEEWVSRAGVGRPSAYHSCNCGAGGGSPNVT